MLAAACGSTPTPATGKVTPATTNPTQATTSSPPQQTPCPPPSNRCLALVSLRGSNRIVVRNVTDISHPKTLSTVLDTLSEPQFVSATELSGIDFAVQSSLIRMPLAGSPKTLVTRSSGLIGYFAWSPDGTSLVYLTQSKSGMALHQLTAGEDRVLGSMPAVPGVGCETLQGCVALENNWDFRLDYSPDGATISLVEQVLNVSAFRIWSAGGKVLASSDSQSRFMSVWSGRTLYFRDASGVEAWRDGVVSAFLPGVAWVRPKAFPNGGQIVYAARDAQGWTHTYAVDTTTRKVRELKKARSSPVFLTSRYVWYRGERACVAADHCLAGYPVIASEKTYIYDLQDGTEAESVITGVYDVWPHLA
jgi:hypothetical protein